VRLVHDWPPLYDDIAAAVGIPPLSAVFTFGDTCYTLADIEELSPDLEVHEAMHTAQQEDLGGWVQWWHMWCKSKSFRLAEELAAYRAQYRAYPKGLKEYARVLASMYGLDINEAQARRMISQ
jgi:hypothetical protein